MGDPYGQMGNMQQPMANPFRQSMMMIMWRECQPTSLQILRRLTHCFEADCPVRFRYWQSMGDPYGQMGNMQQPMANPFRQSMMMMPQMTGFPNQNQPFGNNSWAQAQNGRMVPQTTGFLQPVEAGLNSAAGNPLTAVA
jgi:hypothetical protein